MNDFFTIHDLLGTEQAGPVSILIFLVGFHFTMFVWLARSTGNRSFTCFLAMLKHNRRQLFRSFFSEGPGYLMLPLWLIAAIWLDNLFTSTF